MVDVRSGCYAGHACTDGGFEFGTVALADDLRLEKGLSCRGVEFVAVETETKRAALAVRRSVHNGILAAMTGSGFRGG